VDNYILWHQFANDGLITHVRDVTNTYRHKFVDTTVSTGVPGYRKSKVLWHYEYMDLYERFTDRIKQVLPVISQKFQLPLNPSIELQLTRSGDGDFFKRHQDNGTPDTDLRVLTYVYYFGITSNPQFSGGQLVIDAPDKQVSIDPMHNSLVVFPSEYYHEVMPVVVPDDSWEHGRFTLNGWIRKQC
jgi:SM-20-related protein